MLILQCIEIKNRKKREQLGNINCYLAFLTRI
jgi:hypothetical protein